MKVNASTHHFDSKSLPSVHFNVLPFSSIFITSSHINRCRFTIKTFFQHFYNLIGLRSEKQRSTRLLIALCLDPALLDVLPRPSSPYNSNQSFTLHD